jgi:hypothetical protein
MSTRADHLAWCKSRAIEILDAGDAQGAIASMLSDLGKWSEPLYDQLTLNLLAMDGMLFCKTADKVRHWIEGFG